MPDQPVGYRRETYTIPGYTETQIPDGGRWLIVYHDGDEESVVHHDVGGRFTLGATSGSWQVSSTGARDPHLPEGAITALQRGRRNE